MNVWHWLKHQQYPVRVNVNPVDDVETTCKSYLNLFMIFKSYLQQKMNWRFICILLVSILVLYRDANYCQNISKLKCSLQETILPFFMNKNFTDNIEQVTGQYQTEYVTTWSSEEHNSTSCKRVLTVKQRLKPSHSFH